MVKFATKIQTTTTPVALELAFLRDAGQIGFFLICGVRPANIEVVVTTISMPAKPKAASTAIVLLGV